MGSDRLNERSVRYCHCSLCNNPEERSFQLHSGGSVNFFTLLVSRQCDLLRSAVQFCTSETSAARSSLQCTAEQRLVTRYALQLSSASRHLLLPHKKLCYAHVRSNSGQLHFHQPQSTFQHRVAMTNKSVD